MYKRQPFLLLCNHPARSGGDVFRRQTVVAEKVAGLPDKRLLVRKAKDAHRDGTTGAHGVCDELDVYKRQDLYFLSSNFCKQSEIPEYSWKNLKTQN